MTVGEHIMVIRKQKGLSQGELGKQVGTSGDIIGRYERGVITPSIDVIIKIADTLEVSIDYLVGKTSLELDKNTLVRLEDIGRLPDNEKTHVLKVLDALLRDYKTQRAYKAQ